ncbi:MAG: hypothetical protein QOH57_268 [Mycobacterium sp.]|jgi:hypothetical protein|nr:hypothetical protein [Pseudonocardiales bacterium]MDT5008651.1 hypothetical protein [Mycobacterium sp.]
MSPARPTTGTIAALAATRHRRSLRQRLDIATSRNSELAEESQRVRRQPSHALGPIPRRPANPTNHIFGSVTIRLFRSSRQLPRPMPSRGPHPRGQGPRGRKLPSPRADANAAWLIILAATDLVAWTERSACPSTPIWLNVRSPPSGTGSCTSPPASPAAPAKPGYASTPPCDGSTTISQAWLRMREAFT